MQTLEGLLVEMPKEEPLATFQVDVSEFFGQKPETTVFCFREPDIAQTFQIPVDAQKLAMMKDCIDWPENLRLTVAMLAMGHISPGSKEMSVGLFYVQMAKRNKKLFTYLSSVFNQNFPYLMGSKQAFEDEKKSSGETEEPNSNSASNTPDVSPAS